MFSVTHRGGRSGVVFRDRPQSAVAEAYRRLRTALQFLPDERQGPLVVTSCRKGEGKSTCVSNLGVAFASAGTRVLVVDADLRHGRLHRVFRLDGGNGLSRLLTGDADDAAICRTDLAGLDVLPCGPLPLNPAELLGLPSFPEHVARWRERYDRIVFDAPPLVGLADPQILARRIGRVLMVVRAVKTPDQVLAAAMADLREAAVDVLGVVLTAHRAPERAAVYSGLPGGRHPAAET